MTHRATWLWGLIGVWFAVACASNAGSGSATPDPTDTGGAGPRPDAVRLPDTAPPDEGLLPDHLVYEGAFRLPDDYNWGARGLAFRPGTRGGTLLATGFELLRDPRGVECYEPNADCQAYAGEVEIPTPARAATWEDLPVAAAVYAPRPFDGGRAQQVHREYVHVSDIAYVPRRGRQTSDKVYGAINLWYAEGSGIATFPTIWMANADGSGAQGLFHVGPETSPYHGRKMGAYLFDVPEWYADAYLGGRTLLTGRSRGTPLEGTTDMSVDGGSQGPTLFAFHAWDTDTPSGHLDALPLLYYRVAFPGCAGPNVGDPNACDFPGYTMCDEWTGAAFVEGAGRRAILIAGMKGLGANCYDEPPVTCNDPCSDGHGYHCAPYERQVLFYDVAALGAIAQGERDPWSVLPYAVWNPSELWLGRESCWDLGGLAFDAAGGRLFLVERGLGAEWHANAAVVHVWQIREGGAGD